MNNVIFEYGDSFITKYNINYTPKKGERVMFNNTILVVNSYYYDIEKSTYCVFLEPETHIA